MQICAALHWWQMTETAEDHDESLGVCSCAGNCSNAKPWHIGGLVESPRVPECSQTVKQSFPPQIPPVPASSEEKLSTGRGQTCVSKSGNIPDKVCTPVGDMPGCMVDIIIEAQWRCRVSFHQLTACICALLCISNMWSGCVALLSMREYSTKLFDEFLEEVLIYNLEVGC